MASAEGGRIEAPSEVSMGRGVPSTADYRGFEELSQRGPGGAPAGNAFWRILKATECSLLYLAYIC